MQDIPISRSLVPIENNSRGKRLLLLCILIFSFCCCSIISSFLLLPIFGTLSLLIFLIPTVAIVGWYGGAQAGAITTVITVLGEGYVLLSQSHQLTFIPFSSFFLIVGICIEGLVINYFIDLSKQSPILGEYKRKNDSYTRLNTYLLARLAKAEVEIRARDEFLSIASHELKTPLTSMLLQLQTALHNIRNVSLANFSVSHLMNMLDSTEHQTKRLTKMINDLLNVSLITTGRLELEVEVFDISALVQNVVNHFSERLDQEGYTLSLYAREQILVNGDKLRIEQVITNLISNSIKYGDKKPIFITVTSINHSAKIVVRDKGIGIPPDKIHRVFDRFVRATDSPAYKGLGIGLYISHQIVKSHGGIITVSSKQGKGTSFTVFLPLYYNV